MSATPKEGTHLCPPRFNLLELPLHILALLAAALDISLGGLDATLPLLQQLARLLDLVDDNLPLVSLDQASQALKLACGLLVLQVGPLLSPELVQLGLDLLAQQLPSAQKSIHT